MRIEREFKKGAKKVNVLMTLEKGKLETVVTSDGKEKREQADASSYAFGAWAKIVQRQLKAGLEAAPLANAPKLAEQLLKDLDLDLAAVLAAFPPAEREAIVVDQIAKAEKAGKVVGPDDSGYQRADILVKCPSQPLLRHFLARMQDGKLKYQYSGGGLNGDLTFFATAISNAAREPANQGWIVEEVNRALPDAEPVLKNWLKARIAKFKEQAKTQKALQTAPAKPGQLEEGLLEAIGKNPADDSPRQVWADWLQEHNHPWGEVVTLQCEVARLDAERRQASPERCKAIDARSQEIEARLGAVQSRAATKFVEPIRAYVAEWSFERGLMDRVSASLEKLLKPGAAAAVILRAPGAELTLTGLKKALAPKLAGLPEGRFGSLKLGSKPPADALEKLVQSPFLAGIRGIEVWGVDDAVVLALEASPASVRELTLWHSTATAASVAVLVKAPFAKTLEELRFPFAEQPLDRLAIEQLASLPALQKLGLPLAEAGCGALVAAHTSLTDLALQANGHWDDADCLALARSHPRLKNLDVRQSSATAKGASALLSLGASSLRLDYAGSGLDFAAAKPSEAATLVCPDFSDADAKALAASTFGKQVQFLEIQSDALTDKGAEALMALPAVGTSLYLKGAKLSGKTEAKLKKLRGE